MDADDVSAPDSPFGETLEDDDYEKQVSALQSYINSIPYQCESIEEMQAKLEYIVGRIVVCAQAKNWLVLSTWDGLLQWCAYMHVSKLTDRSRRQSLQLASHEVPYA